MVISRNIFIPPYSLFNTAHFLNILSGNSPLLISDLNCAIIDISLFLHSCYKLRQKKFVAFIFFSSIQKPNDLALCKSVFFSLEMLKEF